MASNTFSLARFFKLPGTSGKVTDKSQGFQIKKKREKEEIVESNIERKEVEVVVGLETKTIDFILGNSEGNTPSNNGFLIEVFDSGSDGKITRLYKEDVVDVLNDETLSEGFENYFILEVDKK